MRIGRLSKIISLSLLSPFFAISSSVHSSVAQEYDSSKPYSTIEIYQSSGEVILRDGGGQTVQFYAKTAKPGKRLPSGNYTIHTKSLPRCEADATGKCLTNEHGYYYPAKFVMYKGKKYITQAVDLSGWGNNRKILYAPLFLGKYNPNGTIRIYETSEGVPAIHSDIAYCPPEALDWYAQSSNPLNYFNNWDGKTISVSPSGAKCQPPPQTIIPGNETFGCIRLEDQELNQTYDFVYRSWENKQKIDVKIFQ